MTDMNPVGPMADMIIKLGSSKPVSAKDYLLARSRQDESGCRVWTGPDRNGYGLMFTFNRCFQAHRFSYLVFKGNIPDRIMVCHTCDNRPCINPDHLFLGTAKVNIDDCYSKGRRRIKGTKAVLDEVFRLWDSGVSQSEIARRLSLGRTAVQYWIKRHEKSNH